jgi:ABC-type transport system substrate-binding protein
MNMIPAKAQELLDELGYGPDNPLTVTMMTWVGGNREKMVQVFQNQLAQVGIETEIETMDIGTMNARVKQENETDGSGKSTFDMMGWAWYDPDILHQLWHSPGAYSGYQTPELDALLETRRGRRLIQTRGWQQYRMLSNTCSKMRCMCPFTRPVGCGFIPLLLPWMGS